MKLLFDEDLVEAAVFRCADRRKGNCPLQVRRFHYEREKLYEVLDPDTRNAAFFRLQLEWFREWGLEQLLAGIVNQFPLLDRLDVIGFRKARGKSEEGAELYVNEDRQRHGVIALRPERFLDDAELVRFLRRELQHLSDMVDPAFGYSRDIAVRGETPSHQRLIRERYRLLWAIAVDGRLTMRGFDPGAKRERRQAEFDHAYSFLPDERRAYTFHSLWNNPAPRHTELLRLAADPRALDTVVHASPGTPCPLCGFATFRWAERNALTPNIIERIQHEFPAWAPEQGTCARCLAVYQSARRVNAENEDPIFANMREAAAQQ